ncbi:MAG: radical SAM protein [Bacteroidales bacterium]|nr:radical SAM protein [Bacteroidales bacterium]
MRYNEHLIHNCYHLPWERNDNPNGWIEPTTYCQLKCPGCYRGVDRSDHIPKHRSIVEMKSHVEWLIKNRNIHTLSIAGGDPLVYPHLVELVNFANQKGLRTLIYTNGIDLDEDYLIRLKTSGATQIIIHVDKFQNRKNCTTEIQVNEVRSQYCELFRKIGGINLGFIQPLCRENLSDLSINIRFFIKYRDIVNIVVYTLYREIGWNKSDHPEIHANLNMNEVIEKLMVSGVFMPAAYLPGVVKKDEPAWLFSYSIGSGSKIHGFLDKKVCTHLHTRYFNRHNRYMFISRSNRIKLSGLIQLIRFRSIRKILLKLITSENLFKSKLFFQTTLIIRGPVKEAEGWDLCQGCPDAILYNGKLQPSCILNVLSVDQKQQY